MHMNQSPHPPSAMGRALGSLARAAIVLFGMLLTLGALMLGMALAAGVLLWALLRGRRPGSVSMRWRNTAMTPRPRSAPSGEVVDAQVREIVEVDPPTQR